MKRNRPQGRSAKSDRLLRDLDVERLLEEGRGLALLEPEYRVLRTGELARLAFHRDADGTLCVGIAVEREQGWSVEESEPYTMRALGYWKRRLKRIGERDFGDDEEEGGGEGDGGEGAR